MKPQDNTDIETAFYQNQHLVYPVIPSKAFVVNLDGIFSEFYRVIQ
jgi:hypothetical protein